MTKPLAVHWASSKPNFGDMLSPLICARLAGRPEVWAPVERCDVVALGSLLQRLKEGFWRKRVHVWGAGFIEATRRHRSRHHYDAVRGRLSAAAIDGIAADVALGDPGLLVNLLVEDRPLPAARHRCVVIPHYKDKGHPLLQQAVEGIAHVEVVDVFAPPLEILDKIRAADFVLSSAMHGLIAADGLGVPNAWIRLSDGLRGGDFKFRDYYSVFDIEPAPLALSRELLTDPYRVTDGYARPGLDAVRRRLVERFPCVP